ncbi:bifunctional 3'-5' exonuclease/ATP-dependent helicase WRN-like [Clytia hemisphaerica]|uniref:bifunctional 3'-5' exonuclease/ATP-dependent helicase WRN-like n=1 Tax=Clytia hemisphaerica TaxID=252671 RepID=UPI0034D6BA3A
MEDQVKYLKTKTCISAVAINQTTENLDEVLKDVEDGIYSLVYTSPESILSKGRLRRLLSSDSFQDHCIGVAIDEAHVMAEWGFADFKKKVFRKWNSNLIELRSLLGSNICFALFTATASRLMELNIFESLGLTPDDFTRVVLDPDRKNICYQVQMVPKVSLSIIFDFVLRDIFYHGDSSTRRLIYCQTRKQCAILYNMFLLKLGSSMYSGGVEHPKKRRVDMFHGGTADSVKSHILEEISKEDSHIRVVICTIAFGMGVNAKGINESIHFGPSKSITSFVQESGRIGREGKPSVSRLFHTSTLTGKVDTKMKEFVHSKDQCRRKILLSLFSNSTSAEYGCGCECCDICALKCECSISKWAPIDFTLKPQNNDSKSRKTSDSALSLLHEKLD